MSDKSTFLTCLKKNNVEYVDFRFTDFRGTWHHMSMPVSAITPKILTEGIFFDGSSIVGWQEIHESDMILIPDFSKLMMDHFSAQPTAIVICDVNDPVSGLPYEKDPRSIAKKALSYLKKTGIADEAYFGSEAEFFIFDNIRFDVSPTGATYEIESDEFPQSGGKSLEQGNHGHRSLQKGAYFPVSPRDSLCDLRAEMASIMAGFGLILEKHHHEVAPSQHEIGVKYSDLVNAADILQIYKYVVHNAAHSYGKTATFMPKPVFGDNGSGMHVHQSLWKEKNPLFPGEKYAGLSDTALYYIGGILKHAKVLNAFTNPTTNSYKRLIPGFEAPVLLAYSERNRSASCRIPLSHGNDSKRVEVRFPDPSCNGYLAFSAMLMAGLDGIKNRLHPGDAMDHDLYAEKEIANTLPTVCSSLREALECLEINNSFLTEGGVFTENFLKSYCSVKWSEVYAFEHTPHPIEFKLYYST
ncbi:MAG: type I glutamate--ammonia ligase [Alphaproteobacteria bacterium]|nr:type I glutamate--ammonia ligase [Alphaproteobacteria bacterium]